VGASEATGHRWLFTLQIEEDSTGDVKPRLEEITGYG
jgi:hypothetical protein